MLAEEGVVVVVVGVDARSGEVLSGPEIITRGWVYAPEAEDLLEEARARVVAGLAAVVPRLLAGTESMAFVDVDDTIREAHGYQKQAPRTATPV